VADGADGYFGGRLTERHRWTFGRRVTTESQSAQRGTEKDLVVAPCTVHRALECAGTASGDAAPPQRAG
jgi:hypothetical protein